MIGRWDDAATATSALTVTGQHDVVVKDLHLASVSVSGSPAITLDHLRIDRNVGDPAPASFPPVIGIRLAATTDSTVTASRIDEAAYGDPNDVGLVLDGGSDRDTVSDTVIAESGGAGMRVTDSADAHIVSNTIAWNDSIGLAVTGTSTGSVVENNILTDNDQVQWGTATRPAQGTQLSVDAAATAQARVGHNLVYNDGFRAPIVWAGAAQHAKDFDAAGLGSADLEGDPLFDGSVTDAETGGDNFGLQWNSPAIDAADSGAPGEPQTDELGKARIDDPDVADTGAGPVAYADFGDGSKPSASGTHTYAAPGNYNGSATFTGVGGETQVVPFSLSPRPTVVTAYADVYTPDSTNLNKIQFSVSGAPGGATYVLDFGDGQKQTLAAAGIVTHQYAGAGVYQCEHGQRPDRLRVKGLGSGV